MKSEFSPEDRDEAAHDDWQEREERKRRARLGEFAPMLPKGATESMLRIEYGREQTFRFRLPGQPWTQVRAVYADNALEKFLRGKVDPDGVLAALGEEIELEIHTYTGVAQRIRVQAELGPQYRVIYRGSNL